jgi:transcriptional regulator with XRE-family HTH domain
MLGDEIRKARLAAKLTQEELAFEAEISRNYVSLLELNEKSPTVDVLFRIARAVGTPASTLVARVERSRKR